MDIPAAMESLVDTLRDAGLSATPNNQGLNPPCAFVHPGPINSSTLGDGYVMTAQVTLIARNSSQAGNLKALGELLTKALTVLEPDGPIVTDATAQIGNDPSKLLPAFTFPINIDL